MMRAWQHEAAIILGPQSTLRECIERRFLALDANVYTSSTAAKNKQTRATAVISLCEASAQLRKNGVQSWSLVSAIQESKEVFGQYPLYAIAVCTNEQTDIATEARAALVATLCRYLQRHLPQIKINGLNVRGANDLATANAVLALCSGLLDDLGGQTLTLTEAKETNELL